MGVREGDTCKASGCSDVVTHLHLPAAALMGGFIHQGYCFTCAYWQALAEQDRTDSRAFVVPQSGGGLSHYIMGDRQGGPAVARGSYGRHFRVRFGPDDIRGTEDLWHQGSIPDRWLPLFDEVRRGEFLHENRQEPS